MYGHDPARTMSSACPSAPAPSSVIGLHPRWILHTDDVVTATPTIVDGVVYAGDWSGRFYAVDLATGALRWSTVLGPKRADGNADSHTGAYGTITSSAAVAKVAGRQMIFVGGGGSLYALDGSNGSVTDARRVLWRTDLDPASPTSQGEAESSPVVWPGAPGGPVVIVGSDANQASGYAGEGVFAVRAATGAVVWHFNPEAYTHHALYGCGNVWSSPALGLDPANPSPQRRAVLYFGTADCPDNSPAKCPSAGTDPNCPPGKSYDYTKRWQPYAEAIVAVSALDGSPLWSFQGSAPLNQNDDDYGPSAQLFTLPSGQAVVGEASKDGTYAVLDRNSGRPVWHQAETGNGNLQPGFALGGFIGTTAVTQVGGAPTVFGASAINTPVTYDPATGGTVLQPLPTLLNGLLAMKAFSASTGSPAWSAPEVYAYGPTSAANGVVYSGSLDGLLRAYDAASGRLLWAFPMGAPVSSGAAITSGAVVIGGGTTESDAEFKACANLPASLADICKQTPLSQTINPLSNLGSIAAFSIH